MYRERHADAEEPAVRWLPFQLNPDLPVTGIARQEYIERKFGPGAKRTYSQVMAAGLDVGIRFAFDNITVQPNTLNAHRLLVHAAQLGRQDEVAEVLFEAYFVAGANLTSVETLTGIGARAGLDPVELETYLVSDEDRTVVLNADIEARNAGVSGVPFFIFNQRLGVSGAQGAEVLLGAMEQAQQ